MKDFFNKCDQIGRTQTILSHLLKKFLTENFIFCAVHELATNFFSYQLQIPTIAHRIWSSTVVIEYCLFLRGWPEKKG